MLNNKLAPIFPSVTVVVPVKNEEAYIDQCLQSLVSQDYPQDKATIVVVDNGSTDGTRDIVRRYGDRVVLLEKKDGTIASIRNYGAQYQDSELIAFLDGDCVVPVNWLSIGHKILMEDEHIACIGFKSAKPDEKASWVARVWQEMSSSSKYTGTRDVPWLSSFNLILKRELFNTLGGFDEQLVTCEDYDLGIRLSKSYRVIFSDTICVAHLGVVNGVIEFFTKELWRGKNNLNSFLKEKFTIGSFLGVAIPVWQLISILFFMFNLLLKIVPAWDAMFILCLIPFLMTLRKVNKKNWKHSLQIFFLYNIYLLARGFAVVGAIWKK